MINDAEASDTLADALGADVLTIDVLAGSIPGGSADADDIAELLLDDTRFVEISTGHYYLPALLEGVELVFLVDNDPSEGEAVLLPPVVTEAARWLILGGAQSTAGDDGQVELTFGTRVVDSVERDVVAGPPGWLPPDVEGLASASTSNGRLRWTAIGERPVPTEQQVLAIRAGFERAATTTSVEILGRVGPAELRFASVGAPFEEALGVEREVFLEAPVPPLDELYLEAGLEVYGDTVAESGTDWDALIGLQIRQELKEIHGLSDDLTDGLVALVGAALAVADDADKEGDSDALGGDDHERDGAAALLAGLLTIGDVAEAFWRELEDRDAFDVVAPFVEALAERLEDVPNVGVPWLRARASERLGDSLAAYEELTAAVDGSCDHRPALLILAGYEADRSELGRAHDLLRRAGVTGDANVEHLDEHEHTLVEEIRGYRRVIQNNAVGRNEPCPCGSGKKFKACHLKGGFVEFEDRAGWLHDKIFRYSRQHGGPLRLELSADLLDAGADDPGEPWFYGPAGLDLVTWEGGMAEGYARSRRPLLPDDEAMLLDPWLATRRSVYEVQKVVDQTVHLLDLADESERVVDNVHHSVPVKRGLTAIIRAVPVGPLYRVFSPMIPVDESLAPAAATAIATNDLATVAACYAEVFAEHRSKG